MKQAHGFTLIELAIVLVIVTILIGGLAMPLSAQIQARRIAETQKIMEEAREAIIGYAMSSTASTGSCACQYTVDTATKGEGPTCTVALHFVSSVGPNCSTRCSAAENVDLATSCPAPYTDINLTLTTEPRHYLPCPSNDGTGIESRYPESAADAGKCIPCNDANHDNLDDATGKRCNLLPWATLGAADQDAWGNRLHYSLTNDPDDPLDPNDTHGTYGDSSLGFSNSSTGNNHVCITSAGGCSTGTVASNVPAVLVSYGPNGWGALNISGKTLKNPTSNDELENTDTDTSFVSRSPTRADSASGEFDDLVVWISDGLLKSRVCPSGGCP